MVEIINLVTAIINLAGAIMLYKASRPLRGGISTNYTIISITFKQMFEKITFLVAAMALVLSIYNIIRMSRKR